MKIKIAVFVGCFFVLSAWALADYQTGNQLFMQHKYEQAHDAFLDQPNDFKCQYGVALTARLLGNFDEAFKVYKTMETEQPDFYETFIGLGICYQMKGDNVNAIKYYEKYLQYKQTPEVYDAIADLYIMDKQYDVAKKTVDEGLFYFPNAKNLKETMIEIYQENSHK